jgi:hypothetical protein
VKTHPPLLVRDALARLFTEASAGNAEADRRLAALIAWAQDGSNTRTLGEIRVEDGETLFGSTGDLEPRFEPLAPYARDRARRYAAARTWIREGLGEAKPLERARAAWDAGLFFEVHEILEPVWLQDRSPQRDALQGLIVAAGALHHLCEGNRSGAESLCRKAERYLRSAPRDFPVDIGPLVSGLEDLARAIAEGEVTGPSDVRSVPPFSPSRGGPACHPETVLDTRSSRIKALERSSE